MAQNPEDTGSSCAQAGLRMPEWTRREFMRAMAGVVPVTCLPTGALGETGRQEQAPTLAGRDLPVGDHPQALDYRHFPDRLHAFVWRNWPLVPLERLARVVSASPEQITVLAESMGLGAQPAIAQEQQRRTSITIIRRNWHLLPYPQLLDLLDWTPAALAYALREDDFLYVKLGNHKPFCEPLTYAPPSEAAKTRAAEIAQVIRRQLPGFAEAAADPLFGFIDRLSKPRAAVGSAQTNAVGSTQFSPRFCYSYFAPYGDPLADPSLDPYPAGYLARLADSGADGVWLQGVLRKMAPFPWDPSEHSGYEGRLARLNALVRRAAEAGLGVYLYLNEPRAMPTRFFHEHPELQGVQEGEYAALCTSSPAVQEWLVSAVASLCKAVPGLAGLFTITASENLSNCWSHGQGKNCPRCGRRSPAQVIAEVNGLIQTGIEQAGSQTRLLTWDWGWGDDWAEEAIARLPRQAWLMSVSEWSIAIERGAIPNRVGEYSISTIGPGPRAQRHWKAARQRGLKTVAKIQAGNTWELSAVPYIPALENVAEHTANLRRAGVDGLMLGWTLGGYPSPNLEVVHEMARSAPATGDHPESGAASVEEALDTVARRRFGTACAPAVVRAWKEFSAAFREFPFDGAVVYNAPLQFGPSNLLWQAPTGYHATMVGFPYDDLPGWRGPYPDHVFIQQLEKVALGFERGTLGLRQASEDERSRTRPEEQKNLDEELNVAEAAAIHFRSTAHQAQFVVKRQALQAAKEHEARAALRRELEAIVHGEMALAVRLNAIQRRDSRIGFEASNQYYYVPADLGEKVLNCTDLLERWLTKDAF